MANLQTIPVLRRTIRMVEALAEDREHTAKTLAIELSIPPATCYRILNTLVDARWVRREPNGTFRLSHGLALLGTQATQLGDVVTRLAEPLAQLATATRLTAKVTVRDGDEGLMVARHEFPKDYIISQRIGLRTPLIVGSAGAVILAQDDDTSVRRLLDDAREDEQAGTSLKRAAQRVAEVRASGFTTDLGETRSFIHAVSVPVDLAPFSAPAALTVLGLAEEVTADKVPALVRAMRKTVREIAAALGDSVVVRRTARSGAQSRPARTPKAR